MKRLLYGFVFSVAIGCATQPKFTEAKLQSIRKDTPESQVIALLGPATITKDGPIAGSKILEWHDNGLLLNHRAGLVVLKEKVIVTPVEYSNNQSPGDLLRVAHANTRIIVPEQTAEERALKEQQAIATRRLTFVESNPGLSAAIRNAVLAGNLVTGMSREAVIASWGNPKSRMDSNGIRGSASQWEYKPEFESRAIYLHFRNNLLESWTEFK